MEQLAVAVEAVLVEVVSCLSTTLALTAVKMNVDSIQCINMIFLNLACDDDALVEESPSLRVWDEEWEMSEVSLNDVGIKLLLASVLIRRSRIESSISMQPRTGWRPHNSEG
jgi:hypothetical protein